MKVIIVLSILLVGAFCASSIEGQLLRDMYSQWKLVHKKAFKAGFEDELRFNIFVKNYMTILAINQEQSSVVLGLNQFADLTSEEFGAMSNGYRPELSRNSNTPVVDFPVGDLPSRVDWREKGAVTPIKNQGTQCGSSWAFGSITALEGLYFIKNGKLEVLSEQYLVDCDTLDQGCCGGYMENAFKFTAQKGVQTEANYPFTGGQDKCHADQSKAIFINSGAALVKDKNATALKAALVEQPVAIAIQADQPVVQFYKAGVIMGLCGAAVNHGVSVVGYDTYTGGIEAFIVRNTWGANWGLNGYLLISSNEAANNKQGVCGIFVIPTIPLK